MYTWQEYPGGWGPALDPTLNYGLEYAWDLFYRGWIRTVSQINPTLYPMGLGSFTDLFYRIIYAIDDLYYITNATPPYGYDFNAMNGILPDIADRWDRSFSYMNSMFGVFLARMHDGEYSWDKWVSDLVDPQKSF